MWCCQHITQVPPPAHSLYGGANSRSDASTVDYSQLQSVGVSLLAGVKDSQRSLVDIKIDMG